MTRLILIAQFCSAAVLIASEAAPPIETAGTDDRGRITVNGKPFFPILMYDVPVDEDSLTMFREHGFNTLSARVEDGELLRQHGFYIAAHAGTTDNIKLDGVLFGVGMDSPALNWKEGWLEKSRDDLAKMRTMFPRRPIFHAIGYWEDEPEGVYAGKLPSKEKYEELVKVIDVSAPYLYPLPYQPVKSVGEAVERANVASGGKKALLPVLQLFAWKPEDRYPTPAELKCMAYLSLIHGADGIAYYSYNYVAGKTGTNIAKEQPQLWAAVKPLNAEIQEIGEFLLESSPETKLTVTAAKEAIEWRAAERGNELQVLLANTSADHQVVQVKWPKSFKRLDGTTVRTTNAAVDLKLRPYEATALRCAK